VVVNIIISVTYFHQRKQQVRQFSAPAMWAWLTLPW